MKALALCTTVYPGVERFLADWYRSVRAQTDAAFDLWIAVDGLEPQVVKDAMGGDPAATWAPGVPGDTPADVRQRALARIVEDYEQVVLVDSDDVLHPARVARAREMLRDDDFVGCALRLVDECGRDLGARFGLPPHTRPEEVLPRNNVFGLSNSALRTDLLRRCLPIPSAVALVDWYLSTRAWLMGARMAFDDEAGMDYRQHGANMARVVAPFEEEQVARDTNLVRSHFRTVLGSPPAGAMTDRLVEVRRVAADVDAFHARVVLRRPRLREYVRALNALDPAPLWWSCVASQSLRFMWTAEEETV
jgi:hypothetical protein